MNAAAKRLLLVDDDRLVLATIAQGLRNAGYWVRTAETIEDGIEGIAHETIDMAIFDIKLGVESGLDLAVKFDKQYRLCF